MKTKLFTVFVVIICTCVAVSMFVFIATQDLRHEKADEVGEKIENQAIDFLREELTASGAITEETEFEAVGLSYDKNSESYDIVVLVGEISADGGERYRVHLEKDENGEFQATDYEKVK